MASDKVAFRFPAQRFSRFGSGQARRPNNFTAVPVCVEFQRLLRQKNPDSIITGVSSRELLNIVVALYDVCLPDIGVDDLRANICARGAKTIILVRDEQEVLEEYQQRVSSERETELSHTAADDLPSEEDERPGMFSFIFSDSESSEEGDESESESDSEEKERFSKGIKDFLASVKERGLQRRQLQKDSATSSPLVIGIESRIVAAMTYQHSVLNSKEKVIQLSLLSTRKRYRGYGVGQYVVKMLQDPSLVGLYDAIVTHADSEAVKFFSKCGFSDDILLNTKFREFEDDWTNTTMMSFFPPFTLGTHPPPLDVTDIELEMELWKMKSLAAYQAQTVFMTRIFHEIRTLRKQLASQEDQMRSLVNELVKTKDEKYQLEKRFLQYRLDKTQQLFQSANLNTEFLLCNDQDEITASLQSAELESEDCTDQTISSENQEFLLCNDQDEITASLQSAELETEHCTDQTISSENQEKDKETIFHQMKLEFIEKMHQYPGTEDSQIEVQELVQASIPANVKEAIAVHVSTLAEPTFWTQLYYCGGLDQPGRLHQILSSGFSSQDLHTGPYGKGLYFSSSASTAARFSPPCQVLVADVHIGNTETVLDKDKDRTCASKGFDSILVPGRLHETSPSHQSDLTQEFIVFSHLQASPVCLLTY